MSDWQNQNYLLFFRHHQEELAGASMALQYSMVE